MSFWTKIRGTVETYWQIGLGGPLWKANTGIVEARNAGDSAYAIVRGAEPSDTSDLATKNYVDSKPSVLPDETDSQTAITGGGGSQVAGSRTLGTTDNRIMQLGVRLWIYERGTFATWGWVEYKIGLSRASGTWSIKTGTDTAADSQLPVGFTSAVAINSGALQVSVTPGANNCYATVEFWDSTVIAQSS